MSQNKYSTASIQKQEGQYTKLSHFTQIPNKVLEDPALDPYDIGVFAIVKSRCDQPGSGGAYFLSQRQMAEAANAATSTFHNSLHLLIKGGYLTKSVEHPPTGGQKVTCLRISSDIWEKNKKYFHDTQSQNVLRITPPKRRQQKILSPKGETECSPNEHSVSENGSECSPNEHSEHESDQVISNTITPHRSNGTHLIPASGVSSLFSDEHEDDSPPEGLEILFQPDNLHIAKCTTSNPADAVDGEQGDYGYMKGADPFPVWETAEAVLAWFEVNQGYSFSQGQKRSALANAGELLGKSTPREAIMTFLFMKHIDAYYQSPSRNAAVNLFLVNKLFGSKNVERQLTLWSELDLPTPMRDYAVYDQHLCQIEQMSNLPEYREEKEKGSQNGQESVKGGEIEQEPIECSHVGCSQMAHWESVGQRLYWCDDHQGWSDLLGLAGDYSIPYPQVVYPGGKVLEGRHHWKQWVTLAVPSELELVYQKLALKQI